MKTGSEYSSSEIVNATQQVAGEREGTIHFVIKVRGQEIKSPQLKADEVRGGGLEAWCQQVRETINAMNQEVLAQRKREQDDAKEATTEGKTTTASEEDVKSPVADKTATTPEPVGVEVADPSEYVKTQLDLAVRNAQLADQSLQQARQRDKQAQEILAKWQALYETLNPTTPAKKESSTPSASSAKDAKPKPASKRRARRKPVEKNDG